MHLTRKNILIKRKPPEAWWVKLCDMGLSKRAEDNVSATLMRGTPGFMAPEKLGLNMEEEEDVDPFPADMVRSNFRRVSRPLPNKISHLEDSRVLIRR